jgi:hypothetical protein
VAASGSCGFLTYLHAGPPPVTSRPLEPGRSRKTCVTSGLQAPRLGGEALQALVLLGHPLAPAARDRRGPDPQTTPSRAAVLLRPLHKQRRRRGPELTHTSDPRLCPRPPQPRALQDRHLLPPRRVAALPTNPRTSRVSPFCELPRIFQNSPAIGQGCEESARHRSAAACRSVSVPPARDEVFGRWRSS